MGAITFTVTGSQAAVEALRAQLENDAIVLDSATLVLSGVRPILNTTALRRPLGLEPLVYFTVAYSAHLAADITAEVIRKWLKDRASRSAAKIEIDEKGEDE